jgi:hydrogenase maturation protease
MAGSDRLVILGIGNLLKGDDGVGVRVIEALAARDDLPAGVELLDGGTGGPTLLVHFEGARALILIDAVDLSAPPGTIRVFGLDDIEPTDDRPAPFSLHDVDILAMFDLARRLGRLPHVIRIIGIQPERFDLGDRLSPAVAAAVVPAAEAVLGEMAHISTM